MNVCSHLPQKEASLMLIKTLIHEHSRMSLGIILLLHSFSRTVVFDFPLGTWLSSFRFLVTQAVLGMGCHLMV